MSELLYYVAVELLSNSSPPDGQSQELSDSKQSGPPGALSLTASSDKSEGDDEGRGVRSVVSSRCCVIKPPVYVFLASSMAALGGVIFGYDTGKKEMAYKESNI